MTEQKMATDCEGCEPLVQLFSYGYLFIYFIAMPLTRAEHGTGPERERERV